MLVSIKTKALITSILIYGAMGLASATAFPGGFWVWTKKQITRTPVFSGVLFLLHSKIQLFTVMVQSLDPEPHIPESTATF
jgi:hypothetical protein